MLYGFISWKWFKRLSLLVVLITLGGPLIFALWTSSAGSSELAAYIKHLDQTDPGWQMADIYQERNDRIKAMKVNSWVQVEKVIASMPKGWDQSTTDIVQEFDKLEDNRIPYPPTLEALREVVQDIAASLLLARELEHLPVGGRYHEMPDDPIGFLLTNIQETRGVMYMLSLASKEAALAGRVHECPSLIIATLNTSRAIGDEPIMISQLVRIAGRGLVLGMLRKALAVGELDDASLARIQRELSAEAEVNLLSISFRGERAFNHRLMELIASGRIDANGLAVGPGPPTLGQRLSGIGLKIYLPSNRKICLESLTESLEISKQPFDAQWKQFKALEEKLKLLRGTRYTFARLLIPATHKFAQAGLRSRAELLAVAAGIACERFRLKHHRWPQSLAEIPQDILPVVPTDPFSGQPIVYKLLPDGVVIYTIGPNEQDDGGQIVALAGNPMLDFGIRLWNPTLRRADPPEPELPDITDDPDNPDDRNNPLDPLKIGGPDPP